MLGLSLIGHGAPLVDRSVASRAGPTGARWGAIAHDVTVTSTTPRPTGRRNARLGQTVGDMVRSLAVVLALVGVLVLVTYQSQQQEVRTVDVATVAAQAQRQAPFDLLVWPAPDGAQATSVRWQATEGSGGIPVWHLGYLVNGEDYLQISQSATTDVRFVPEQTAGGKAAGELAAIRAAESSLARGHRGRRHDRGERNARLASVGEGSRIDPRQPVARSAVSRA